MGRVKKKTIILLMRFPLNKDEQDLWSGLAPG